MSAAEERPAALEITESFDLQRRYLRETIVQSVAATLGVTAVCAVIAMGVGMYFVGRPMQRLYEQAERMAAIIRQLMDFARRRALKLESWDLQSIVRETVGMLAPLARKRGVRVAVTTDADSSLARVDRFQAQQVVTNLTMNAIQAVEPGGCVEVEVGRAAAVSPPGGEGGKGDFVRVTVRDDGPGIPPDAVARVFEPFFTTKGVGEGTGLGLSVAYGIVQEHGGWIDVESSREKGTAFSVYLRATGPVGAGASA